MTAAAGISRHDKGRATLVPMAPEDLIAAGGSGRAIAKAGSVENFKADHSKVDSILAVPKSLV